MATVYAGDSFARYVVFGRATTTSGAAGVAHAGARAGGARALTATACFLRREANKPQDTRIVVGMVRTVDRAASPRFSERLLGKRCK
jgi:hypothetical protein